MVDDAGKRYIQWCPKLGRNYIRPYDAAMQLNKLKPNTLHRAIMVFFKEFEKFNICPTMSPVFLLEHLRPAYVDRF